MLQLGKSIISSSLHPLAAIARVVGKQGGRQIRMMAGETKARRVVVTGLGVVSGVGTGVQDFWDGLLAGESSIKRIESFDPDPFKCKIGSEVRGGARG